jgi:ribosomal protein S18 acetylase RimI-like enzyme
MQPANITQCSTSDWQALGSIIGAAFAEDPIITWIFPNAHEITRLFLHLARHVYLPRGICCLAGEAGGTMWLPPGQSSELPLPAMLSLAVPALFRIGPAPVLRALRVSGTMAAHHPKAPHYYLFAVGVLPEARGRGLARQMLASTLAQCDKAGLPAYLENSNARNTSLYQSLGFQPQQTFAPAPGCPVMTTMWRPIM